MTQEEKQLLVKDLCARLPYGIIANYILFDKYSLIGRVYLWTDECFYIKKTDKYSDNWTWNYETATSCMKFDKFKPYLRPMSSMTDEEKKEYYETMEKYTHRIYPDSFDFSTHTEYLWTKETFDWLNAHHFDFRRLIEKGLALPATDGMYDFK